MSPVTMRRVGVDNAATGPDRASERGSALSAVLNPAADALGRRTGPLWRWRWSVWGSVWLIFLAGAFHDAVVENDLAWERVLGVGGLAAFCVGYAFGPPLLVTQSGRDPVRVAFPFALWALATALLPLTGFSGLTTYVFVAVIMIMIWPPKWALVGIASLIVLTVPLSFLVPGDDDPAGTMLSIALASLAVWGVVSVIRRNEELAHARDELARLAVEEERLRFSRDLHDIVGHSLTSITVKSELARRLIGVDDTRAVAELAEVERVSRDALRDVRSAVQGYREVTLASELAKARSILAAAGIDLKQVGAVDSVPSDLREVYGWVVREGVTNVVRHSRARSCTIRVEPTGITVVDDGMGSRDMDGGTGLTGLRERVANAGGSVYAGPAPGRGWQLTATVPG